LNRIINTDCLSGLRELDYESVDCCITSPPYWGLRDYGLEPLVWDAVDGCQHEWGNMLPPKSGGAGNSPDKPSGFQQKSSGGQSGALSQMKKAESHSGQFCSLCGAWRGSLGLEPTFQLYIKHLIQIFSEVKRVLKPTGTCWVNLGDSYSGSGKGIGTDRTKGKEVYTDDDIAKTDWKQTGVVAKSLCQIPSRFAIAMTDAGWILRNEIIWKKVNCMPSSAKDRFTVDFEKLFFFTKQGNYWFEQQFEEYAPSSDVRYQQALRAGKSYKSKEPYKNNTPYCSGKGGEVENEIKAGLTDSSAGTYKRGQGSVKSRGDDADGLVVGGHEERGRNKRCVWSIPTQPLKAAHFAVFPEALVETPIKAGCPVGGLVLDPFMGAGTVAVVALKRNRKFIGFELNPEYIEIAEKRISPLLQQTKLEL